MRKLLFGKSGNGVLMALAGIVDENGARYEIPVEKRTQVYRVPAGIYWSDLVTR
jgi:hypothetical protein